MKKYIPLILFVCGITQLSLGQDLIKPSGDVINPEITKILNTRIAVAAHEAINISLDETNMRATNLSFFDKTVVLQKDRIERRTENNFTWFGRSQNSENIAILTVNLPDIQGIITVDNKTYRIETILGQPIITLLDQSKYPSELCNFNGGEEDGGDSKYNTSPEDSKDNKDGKLYKSSYPSQSFWDYQCKLRVLVLFTSNAKSQKSDMENHIRLAMDEMNQSFLNSGVNFQAELVFVGETSYSEASDMSDDVIRFANPSDGHIDIVDSLRETYSADVCVLIVDNPYVCGIARGLKVCEENAFCVCHWDCATGYFSFAHEIGHLVGCQHHPNDPTDSGLDIDLPYAHGFKNDPDDWRTIMSYDCPNECDRIMWWSNPDSTRSGDAMGTNGTHNNTRVWNENMPNALTFRPCTGKRIVTQSDINSAIVGVIYHPNKVQTVGSVIVPSGSSWGFLSSKEVELNPGFEASIGATFEAKIIDKCGVASTDSCNYSVFSDMLDGQIFSDMLDGQIASAFEQNSLFKAYPNPNKGISVTFVVLNYNANHSYEIFMTDINGKVIHKMELVSRLTSLDLNKVESGLYFLTLRENNRLIETQKIIIVE